MPKAVDAAELVAGVVEPPVVDGANVGPDPDAPPPLPAGAFEGQAGGDRHSSRALAADGALRARAAGWLLIANAAMLGLHVLTRPSWLYGWPAYIQLVADLVVGGMLFRANGWVIRVAQVRCLLLALWIVILLVVGQHYMAAVLSLFCLGLAGLLFGWMRVRNAMVSAALSFVLVLALYRVTTPSQDDLPPLDKSRLSDIEPAEVELANGRAFPYTIRFQGPGWHLRMDSVTKRDNRLADQWLVHPERNAHVVVIAEESPDTVTIEQFANAIASSIRRQEGNRAVFLESFPLKQNAFLIRTRETCPKCSASDEIEIYYALFVERPYLFQVITYASPDTFATMAREFLLVIASFRVS